MTQEGCAYHAQYKEDCLYCRGRQDYKPQWQCKGCGNTDKRVNIVKVEVWCGACGKKEFTIAPQT